MGYHQVEVVMSIEHATENEMRDPDGFLDRLPNAVDHEEPAAGHAKTRADARTTARAASPAGHRADRSRHSTIRDSRRGCRSGSRAGRASRPHARLPR